MVTPFNVMGSFIGNVLSSGQHPPIGLVGVTVGVGVFVLVGVLVGVTVGVFVLVGVIVGVGGGSVGVTVGVGVIVGVGVGVVPEKKSSTSEHSGILDAPPTEITEVCISVTLYGKLELTDHIPPPPSPI
jgi:hypothetical protein